MCEYAVKNVVTQVHASNSILENAIKDMLHPFIKQEESPSVDRIEFHLAVGDGRTAQFVLPASAELVLDMGSVRFYEKEELRYVEADSIGWGIANISEGKANIIALENQTLNTWSIAHLLFYPLWVQLLKAKGIYALHAAGAVKDGITILFPAYSGSGKSVLSLNLFKAGYSLLSDDTVFLSEENDKIAAIGYPEKINLRPDGAAMFPDMPIIEPAEGTSWKACVDIKQLSPGCFVDKSVPNAVVFIERNNTSGSRYATISKADALIRLFKYSLFFVDKYVGSNHFQLLSKLAEQSKCYLLTIGTDREVLQTTVDRIVQEVSS
jgi:hypothetical protein